MSEFLFLYRGGIRPASPELAQQSIDKWVAWFKRLADQGHILDRGHPLDRSGKIVSSDRVITDGPFTESKDIVGGYTLVEARDVSEAAELAKGCPILDRGGRIEVRPVMKLER